MTSARALILAAGKGTRLRPLTDRVPKCLVPLAGRPLLEYWLMRLADSGVREATINTHAHALSVENYLTDLNGRRAMKLRSSFEPELLGSAGTISANARLADGVEQVVVIYADNLSDVDLSAMLDYHRQHDDPVTMMLFRTTTPHACGIAEIDDHDRVVQFVEKPERPPSDLANAGVYIFDTEAYREVAAMRAFDIGFDVLPRFVGRMRGWQWDGYHRDIGNADAYEQAQQDVTHLNLPWKPGQPRPAVFFDRDGTLIEQVDRLSDPDQVRLLPHAAELLRQLRAAGYATVIVSNQSAVGRGQITADQVHAVNERMCVLLAAHGAVVDALDYCPAVPRTSDRTVAECVDRKPGPGMLHRAAEQLDLDLAASWMIGDMISDALAGYNAGCRGSLLVATGKGITEAEQHALRKTTVVRDLYAAGEHVLHAQLAT
ncbi:MAG: HAD-IIIA family hydrolase [Phycisphaeraceae bacterium]